MENVCVRERKRERVCVRERERSKQRRWMFFYFEFWSDAYDKLFNRDLVVNVVSSTLQLLLPCLFNCRRFIPTKDETIHRGNPTLSIVSRFSPADYTEYVLI